MKLFKTNIDLKSFLRTKPKPIKDDFGVSFVTGYQGSGKPYIFCIIWYNYLIKIMWQ